MHILPVLIFINILSTDAPSAPGMPEVEEVGGDFVSLQWAKPSTDGGGKILGYWIDKREHGKEDWTRVNPQICITNMINIPNLIEDRRYEFRVFAENGAGFSKPSSASNAVKIKDPHGKLYLRYWGILLFFFFFLHFKILFCITHIFFPPVFCSTKGVCII